ncbi:MAG: Holliday junction resolvase RuvX [Bifidobacterium aquikefiri]|uniref:Putative pre-16S rRNA nuclease n=1 Tax=Bifidobacterium aquikefiri TaxID=1653207 RepID=A0A261G682_9BIFI|nr:Holliday junction resolvase RuvX [Bifidobacterium aquikefiri]OZG66947.1 Holliday junction DNA helicase [Bifidobacterium aquikefiri]
MTNTVWLGVDLGNARVGLALSDLEVSFAHPAGNVEVQRDSFEAIERVIQIIEDNHVARVIVGYPLLLDGKPGKSAKKAMRWVKSIRARIESLRHDDDFALDEVPVITLSDERLTTVTAHAMLLDAHVSSRAHRPKVDQQSAVVILQSAIDAKSALRQQGVTRESEI